MEIRERIFQLIDIKAKGIVSRFERLCKLSNGSIRNISHSIRPDTLEKIINAFPDINRKWLLYNDGDMLIDTSQSKSYSDKEINFDMLNEPEFNSPEKLKQAIHLMELLIKEKTNDIEELRKELILAQKQIIQLQQSLNVKTLESINKQP
jgi:hypothetical protein